MSETPLEEQVTWSVADGIGRLTINQPDQGNSLTAAMRDRIGDLMLDASGDLNVRVVVVGAAGERHFCTGANLGGPRPPAPAKPEGAPEVAPGDAARMIRRGWQRLIASVLDCEKPVVAAVNGTAAGGGAQLVLACDIVVMADRARFIEVFVRRGIIPDAGGAYLLPRLVGPQRAKEIMFLGEDVSATDAERWGIANHVVPADQLQATVDDLATRLAAQPTRALALTKWLVNRSFESSRHTAFEEEAYAQELNNFTADSKEGLSAFVERRDTDFKGW
jgi:2-(1,2-epoxy-1,2-dihydrophenyl)acetyl-CoA isomerase